MMFLKFSTAESNVFFCVGFNFFFFANVHIQAEELGNRARELKGLIDDSESVVFINLDRWAQTIEWFNLCVKFCHMTQFRF